MFQGRGGFAELGHYNKLFIKTHTKKTPQGKILELFLLDTLKTTCSMEDSSQGWIQLGPFFPKSGHFFQFSKMGKGRPHPLRPLVARLVSVPRVVLQFFHS